MAQILPVDTPDSTPAQFHPSTAYTAMIGALLSSPPDPISPEADDLDVETRYQHVEAILSAVTDYIGAIVKDTAGSVPGGRLDDSYIIHVLHDTCGDVVGHMQEVAHQMQTEMRRNWRAA